MSLYTASKLSTFTAALALLTACHGINLTPRSSHATLSVNPDEIHVQHVGITYRATIPFVYVNTTARPVSKASCGVPIPGLEKKVNDRWVPADDDGVLMCRTFPAFSVASGHHFEFVVPWIANERGHSTGPQLLVDSVPGIYRLRFDLVQGIDPDAKGARRIETVSNEFRMVLSEDRLSFATQLVVVTTAGWDSTTGKLRRFFRDNPYSYWREDGTAVPVVVGRTGLAWGVGFDSVALAAEPHKREGDGRSPAGIFPIDTVFGFAAADSMRWLHLPYVTLTANSDCVDDTASVHYNTVVDRSAVPSVDWQSAEHMRQVAQYRLGAIIGYNAAPPMKGRGSCIFFHIWAGPRSTTVGCTALDAAELERLLAWFNRRTEPVVVQVPASVYRRLYNKFDLPWLDR
jgi:L,D-peptidoglycan transpeptidase YkuD (ErfK/YbiS/YcfS/YnhG family)